MKLIEMKKILYVCGFAFNGKSRCDNDQSKWHSTNSKVGAVIWKGMWVSGYQLEIDSAAGSQASQARVPPAAAAIFTRLQNI